MQCILSALKAESQPFIDYYDLERDSSFPLATSADKDCLGRFFTKKNESFSNWENNCLNTGSL